MTSTLHVGTRKGLFQVAKHKGAWQIVKADFLGAQVPTLHVSRDGNTIFAGLKHGHFGAKMHRSSDGGITWQEIATPAYPHKPDDVPDIIDQMRNVAIPWSLELIWCLEQGSDGRLWCGTIPGGLFTSDDQGGSWQLNMPLWMLPNRQHWMGGGYDYPGIHSVCIDPNDPKKVTVAISCGGVWQSRDGGVTWQSRATGMRAEYMPPDRAFDPDIQDPHRMVQCRTSPNHFWVQHHNGIFRSADEGANWQEIAYVQPSGFGFAVVVSPHDPNTAWFVPAVKDSDRYPVDGQFVVTRTRDGGKSFEVLRNGLPQSHAYHLVYRHAMDISFAGNILAMGSTTGGLWISEDAGDHWQHVTSDLPPIFTVRF